MAGEDLKVIEEMMLRRVAASQARQAEREAQEAARRNDPAVQDLERRAAEEHRRGSEPVPRFGEIVNETRQAFFARYRAWCHRNPLAAAERKRLAAIARSER